MLNGVCVDTEVPFFCEMGRDIKQQAITQHINQASAMPCLFYVQAVGRHYNIIK